MKKTEYLVKHELSHTQWVIEQHKTYCYIKFGLEWVASTLTVSEAKKFVKGYLGKNVCDWTMTLTLINDSNVTIKYWPSCAAVVFVNDIPVGTFDSISSAKGFIKNANNPK